MTKTDDYQNNNMAIEKLKGYSKIEDINNVSIGSHVRYFTWKNNTQKFCFGGFLREKHIDKGYVKLSNGSHDWSVQLFHYSKDKKNIVYKTKFYVKNNIQQTNSSQPTQTLTIHKLNETHQNNDTKIHSFIADKISRQKKYFKKFKKDLEHVQKRHQKIQIYKTNNKLMKQDLI